MGMYLLWKTGDQIQDEKFNHYVTKTVPEICTVNYKFSEMAICEIGGMLRSR